MASELTIENFTKAMEEVVAEYGEDYVYVPPSGPNGSCVYQDDKGQPSCLIGHVLHRLGVKLDPLWDKGPAQTANVILRDCVGAPPRLSSAARRAQVKQDCGAPWGESLAAFKAALR